MFIIKVEDSFNITGRGTVIVGELEGTVKSGEKLTLDDGEEIFIIAIESGSYNHTKNVGLVVRYDYEKSKELIGKEIKGG